MFSIFTKTARIGTLQRALSTTLGLFFCLLFLQAAQVHAQSIWPCPLPASTPPGTRDSCFAPFSSAFPGSGFDNTVFVGKLQSDGKLVLGGDFSSYNLVSRGKIARLNTDGTLDLSFAPQGTSFNSQVNALAIQPDGKIICGGTFTSYNTTNRNFIIRLMPDGTFDPTFTQVGTGFDNVVNTILLQPDGKILVGGSFNVYGTTNIPNLARLNSDGTLDNTFTPVGTSLNDDVNSLSLQSDNKIIVGGNFTNYNGTSANKIIRLNTDGTRDATFVQPGAGFGTATFVSRVLVQPDGNILVTGGFTSYGTGISINIARLLPNGSLDPSFVTGNGFDNITLGIALLSNNDIMVCGLFQGYNTTANPSIVRLSNTGALVSSFTPGAGFGGSPLEVIPTADGKVFVLGAIATYRGVLQVGLTKLFANPSTNPTISNFIPAQATAGQTITLTGTNLTGATSVTFGGVPAASFTVNSPTSITAVLASGASGAVQVVTPTGTATANGFSFLTVANPIVVTSFSPLQAPVGDRVRIRGIGLSQVATVLFNTTQALQIGISGDTLITAIVPPGATAGRIGVSVSSGPGVQANRRSNAFFYPTTLMFINSFSPGAGSIGDTVTISGRNMGGFTAVRFNGARALYAVVIGDTIIRAKVPIGSSTGKINITNTNGQSILSANNFTLVQPPSITSFSPASGPIGERVRVRGVGFTGVRGVFFGLIQAIDWAISGDTLITAIVPVGAINARIGVSNQAGSTVQVAQSAPFFNITFGPVIRSLQPASGNVGDTVRIIGRRLSNIIQVRFNNNALRAPFHLAVNDTLVKTVVPFGAVTGLVRVINSTFSFANSPNVFTAGSGNGAARQGFADNATTTESLSLYPNPAQGAATLTLEGAALDATYGVSIWSADGRLVSNLAVLGSTLQRGLSITNLTTPGVYQVRLTAGTDQKSLRLVVE